MRNVKLLWGVILCLLAVVIVLFVLVVVKSAIPRQVKDKQPLPPVDGERDKVVATVGGRQFTESDIQQRVYRKYGPEMLKQLIDREVVRLEADKNGIKTDRAEIDNELIRMQQGYQNEDEFYKAMQDQLGLTKDELREDVYDRLLLEKIAIGSIKVPDASVDEYIRAHADEFKVPVQLRIQQIVVGTRDQANKLIDDLKKGGDFASLAKDRSLDDASRNTGGDLGWIEENDPFVKPPLLKAAKELKPGDISKPVELDGKFIVIKLKDRKDAKTGEQQTVLRERIRKEMALRQADPLPDILNKLRDKWHVSIAQPLLR